MQHHQSDLRCRGQPYAEKMPTLVPKRRIQLWFTVQDAPLSAAISSSTCLHLHAVAWYVPTRIIRKISDGICSAHGHGSSHARPVTRLGHPRVRRTAHGSESGRGDSQWRALISSYACTLAHAQQEFLYLPEACCLHCQSHLALLASIGSLTASIPPLRILLT